MNLKSVAVKNFILATIQISPYGAQHRVDGFLYHRFFYCFI